MDSESTEWIAALCANQHSTVTNVKPEPAELCDVGRLAHSRLLKFVRATAVGRRY